MAFSKAGYKDRERSWLSNGFRITHLKEYVRIMFSGYLNCNNIIKLKSKDHKTNIIEIIQILRNKDQKMNELLSNYQRMIFTSNTK
jgi:hypothetical protein